MPHCGCGQDTPETAKKGKRPVSHRINLLPLLPSGPHGVQRELVVQDLPFFAASVLLDSGEANQVGTPMNRGQDAQVPTGF